MDFVSSNERTRRIRKRWDSDFKTPEQYIEFKLEMLQNEMYIEPTKDEISHLKKLKTMSDIDRAVHSIIARHWDDV